MSIRDEVLQVLAGRPDGMTDAQLAVRLGKLHQQINSRCRQLASDGLIVRDSATGTIVNRLIQCESDSQNQPISSPPVAVREVLRPEAGTLPARTWPHEAAVQGALVSWLTSEGWRIARVADTESRERGTDIVADRDGVRLEVEVKGYPGTTYARGPKAGQPKPTSPTLQASHWLANAVLKAMRMRNVHSTARVVIALPDYPRYRSLLTEVDQSLLGAGIEAWLVHERGEPSIRYGGSNS